jgi:hypothetical protein
LGAPKELVEISAPSISFGEKTGHVGDGAVTSRSRRSGIDGGGEGAVDV